VTCAAENRPNATSFLNRCCDSELGVYGYGCYAWCSGGGELQRCIDDNQKRESGSTIFCQQSADDSSSEASKNDGDSSSDVSESGVTRVASRAAILVYALSALLFQEMLF